MAARIDALAVSAPGLRAMRWFVDELHVGVKERYTIARVESGRSEWWSGGKIWTSGPGALQVQGPDGVCRDLSRDGPSTCQIISLSAADVESVVGKVRPHPSFDAGDERGAAFHRLHDAVKEGADRFRIEVAVAEAIMAFAHIQRSASSDVSRPVRRAIELLRSQLAESVTLDLLAAHAGIEKHRLCRAFRAQVGLAPHAYLTRLRIVRAKELLATGTRASEVAMQVGFYDQSQLHRHFRSIVGVTPRQYARGVARM